jgi:flavorubredoxin
MSAPIRRCEPERLAPDTFLIRQLYGEGVAPVAMYVNSMVITGKEPVILDTGPAVVRDDWFADVFSIVEPEDVRWIFLSHDDPDHTGNLLEALDVCPNATLVTNWFSVERLGTEFELPMHRMRWVNDGERFGTDGQFVAVVPPTFDSPTTRGLFDSTTGVYWASDSFACPVTHEVTDMAELDPAFWEEAFLQTQRVLSPWHQWMDSAKYGAHLARVRGLEATVVGSAHGTALRGSQIDVAYDLLAQLPDLPAAPLPGQADLEAMMAAITAGATEAAA